MRTPRLDRRSFLRGALGTSLALPFLEIMTPRRARAVPGAPGRFLFAFGGISTQTQSPAQHIVPAPGAVAWADTLGLRPLHELGLQEHAAFVSGLTMPWMDPQFDGRPARRVNEFHHGSIHPLVTGTTGQNAYSRPQARTCDSAMAEVLSPGSPQLAYRVQYDFYKGSISDWNISADGADLPVPPQFSPSRAYVDFTSALTASEEERRRRLFEQARGLSVLDLTRDANERLEKRLGREDQLRFAQFQDSLRALERRVSGAVSGTCNGLPGFPGDDAAYKTTIEGIDIRNGARCSDPDADGENGDAQDMCRRVGYSFESERGDLFVDLVALAFQCDLRRSVSLMITYPQTFLSAVQMLSVSPSADPDNEWFDDPLRTKDLHELGHDPSDAKMMAFFYRWHVGFLARLAAKLRDLDEGGTSILDRTAMVFATEGGWGYDAATGAKDSPHSTENMTAVVLGGKALGLKLGQHVVAKDRHPGEVVLAAMRAAAGDRALPFGEIDTHVDALL